MMTQARTCLMKISLPEGCKHLLHKSSVQWSWHLCLQATMGYTGERFYYLHNCSPKGQRQRKHKISVTRLLTAAHGGMKETARVSGEQKRS
jgi:hypothetical protein